MFRSATTLRYPRLSLEGLEDRTLPSGLGLLSALQLFTGPVPSGSSNAGAALTSTGPGLGLSLSTDLSLGSSSLLVLRLGSSAAVSADNSAQDTPVAPTSANTGTQLSGLGLGVGGQAGATSGTTPTTPTAPPSLDLSAVAPTQTLIPNNPTGAIVPTVSSSVPASTIVPTASSSVAASTIPTGVAAPTLPSSVPAPTVPTGERVPTIPTSSTAASTIPTSVAAVAIPTAPTAPSLEPSLPGAGTSQTIQFFQTTQSVSGQSAAPTPGAESANMPAQVLVVPHSGPPEAAPGVGGPASADEVVPQAEEAQPRPADRLDSQPTPDGEGAGLITHFQPSPTSPMDATLANLSEQAERLVDELGYRLSVSNAAPWLLGVVLASGAYLTIRRSRSQATPDEDEIAWSLELAELSCS